MTADPWVTTSGLNHSELTNGGRLLRPAPVHGDPRVLLICDDHDMQLVVELALPEDLHPRTVRSAADTEGIGTEVVIVAGRSLADEIDQVRVHPSLSDKPVIVFAPALHVTPLGRNREDVYAITEPATAVEQLAAYVKRLLPQRSHRLPAPDATSADAAGGTSS